MSVYSNLPIYNTLVNLLKDLHERVPRFSKEYKYFLGEKMLKCCVDSLVLLCKISASKEKISRIEFLSQIENNMNVLLIYMRIANELNQLTKKDNYFFLSKKVVEILNQAENWKKFLQNKKCSQNCTSDGRASVDKENSSFYSLP